MLTNNPNDFKVPISWETFDVEPHVSGAPSDPFAGLRSLVDHVFGDKVSDGIPVSVIRCRPVRGYNIARLTHTLESSVGQARTGDPSIWTLICAALILNCRTGEVREEAWAGPRLLTAD